MYDDFDEYDDYDKFEDEDLDDPSDASAPQSAPQEEAFFPAGRKERRGRRGFGGGLVERCVLRTEGVLCAFFT